MSRLHLKIKSGYITLMSVLVVGAIGISISASLLLLGLGSSRTSYATQQMYQAKALANACAEEAMEQIRALTSYTGNGNLSFSNGNCTYIVTSGGGQNRAIAASGTVGSMVRKVSVVVSSIEPLITISTWQEVP
jgi:hypothetical protein